MYTFDAQALLKPKGFNIREMVKSVSNPAIIYHQSTLLNFLQPKTNGIIGEYIPMYFIINAVILNGRVLMENYKNSPHFLVWAVFLF